MRTIDEIKTIIRQHRDVLAERYGIAVVGIFGSYVREEQGQQSDIDLLADILRPISLLELVGAELYLNEILGAKVDLVPKRDVRENCERLFLGRPSPYEPKCLAIHERYSPEHAGC